MPKNQDQDNDRRATLNRLREYLRGPLPDDVRSEIEETIRQDKVKDDAKPWWRFGKK